MLDWLFSWEVASVSAPVFIGIGFAVLGMNDYKLGKLFFLLAAIHSAGGTVMWGMKAKSPTWFIALTIFVVVGAIGSLTVLAFRYVDSKKPTAEQKTTTAPTLPKPSFVFIIGAPLGDNNSASWIMLLRHYGPDPAYSCDINFSDDDRKNIEHLWLVAHPNSPFPPPGLAAGESQTRAYVPEVGPEGAAGSFTWKPLDPDRQHYTVSISCRDGAFEEKWEVTRVNGILRAAITIKRGPLWIQKKPGLDPIVFRREDAEFVRTPLATAVPKSNTAKVVHPGWKPNHRFEIPAAIIDPNGNIEIVSGIKQPDGSTLTDFGSWNLLTRHFGDDPSSPH